MSLLVTMGSKRKIEGPEPTYLEITHGDNIMTVGVTWKKGRLVLVVDADQEFRIQIKKRNQNEFNEYDPSLEERN
ncbi:MAG: hypothetical protein H7245_09080 [Candidatus Saccharibacteria bacterium]|nr:hypothetical protein [Pseudorhodobacter sp.]